MSLVEILSPEFKVKFDIRYATDDNFTGQPVYARGLCYLHPDAADAFKNSIRIADEKGLTFKVFDAYRPLEVQQSLWKHTPDPDFLSNPEGGSCPHCRGVAIDLTLLDENGVELNMGTGFDEFTPLSHHGNEEVEEEAQRNREMLKAIMMASGWDYYKNEWWHYQLFNCRDYPLLTDEEAGTGMVIFS